MHTIVIADEQPLLRAAVQALLNAQGHRVVAALDNGADALQQALALEPELLILDLALPRLGGLEVIRRLHQRQSPTRTLVLTAQSTEHIAGLCLQAGASGFVSKLEAVEELGEAVRTLLRGRAWFPVRSLGSVAAPQGLQAEDEQLLNLSPRERTVLQYLVSGRSNKDIAYQLNLSDRTVSTYKARLLQKLNAGSLAELLEIAWRGGLIERLPTTASALPGESRDKYFHELFEAMPMPVCLRDVEGYLLNCNRRFLEVLDTTLEKAVGKRVIDSERVPPHEALQFHQRYLQAVAAQQPYSMELVVHDRGKEIALHHWGAPFRDAQGALVGMLCSFVDMTAHEQALISLTHANEQNLAVRRARLVFLHQVGEEFRHMLEMIAGRLREVAATFTESAALDQARQDIRKMLERIGVLLDLADLESGTLLLRPRATDLVRLTRETLQAATADGVLSAEWQAPQAPTPGWIDRGRYRQIVGLLLHHCGQWVTSPLQVTASSALLGHAEMLWELRIGPQQADEPFDVPDDTLEPALVLCERLAQLMGGQLRWHVPPQGDYLLTLRLRLPQATP
ncbi:response regulator [Pseudomonas sp. GD03860]|uniref:response regulator n=1 Tax=Pseudomonas TaxID=286 RepID=UPI002363BAF1|nr:MULTISPECIES: response regulator [Pseudomonas]MDD2058125.1 response regulator [Pseudomonas putida]MDH0636058.1 response regulator [Pseudomonas sp. GD03860]